jgi:hypothetical protein
MISEIGTNVICSTFKHHPTLLVLDLSLYKSTADMGSIPNNMGDNSVKYLCDLIENNTSLLYLNVAMNNISDEGINQLASSLEKNNTLLFFHYKQYGLETKQTTTQRIDEYLMRNKTNYEQTNNITVDSSWLRNLKHSKRVANIDSIYRNSMK